MNRPYIIAEAGVNHNGDRKMAFKLIDAAVEAGADAVKFQTFKAENLVTKNADKAAYQKDTTDNNEAHFDMLKKLELSHDLHYELIEYCKKQNIEFLSTAFDLESLDFLVNSLKLKTLKIPSGDITNGLLLLAYAQTGCKLILSTGMATYEEVGVALELFNRGAKKEITILKFSFITKLPLMSLVFVPQFLNLYAHPRPNCHQSYQYNKPVYLFPKNV